MNTILVFAYSEKFVKYLESLLKGRYLLHITYDKTELPTLARNIFPSLVLVEKTAPDTLYVIELLHSIEQFKALPFLCFVPKEKIEKYPRLFEQSNVDIVEVPIFDCALLNRIKNYCALNPSQISNINAIMETNEFAITQTILLDFIDAASDYRSTEPKGHVKRMQNYAKALAIELQKSDAYREEISDTQIMSLFLAAPLHDIGKAAVPDSILHKKGTLSPQEFDKVKTHTTAGYEALKGIENKLNNTEFLMFASDIVYCHHERWDGAGYPRGLKGAEVSIFSRIMGLVDVYDALISITLYRDAYSHSEAVAIIKEERSKHFCPDVTDAFLCINEDFKSIAIMNTDSMVELDKLNG
ncbi:MAG: HD domain-containing protein [Fibrobacterales bacterium]